MPLLDQITKILQLLEAAKDDIQAWIDCVKEEGYDGIDTSASEDLVAEIESILHETGF